MSDHSKWIAIGLGALTLSGRPAASRAEGIQSAALLRYSQGLCETQRHRSGAACRDAVTKRFPACAPAFLNAENSPVDFAACLGFELPREQAVKLESVASCDAPQIRLALSLRVAKDGPWRNAVPRKIDSQSYSVAKVPFLETRHVQRARLETAAERSQLSIELGPEGTRLLGAVTESHVGDFIIISVNGKETAARLASKIPGPKLLLPGDGLTAQDVCEVMPGRPRPGEKAAR